MLAAPAVLGFRRRDAVDAVVFGGFDARGRQHGRHANRETGAPRPGGDLNRV